MNDLAQALRALRESEDQRMRSDWNRSLPLAEELFDRWGRARELGFGDKTSIHHNSYVYGDVRVGRGTWIGPMTILDGSGGGLVIGDNCSISAGAQIYTHSTVRWAVSGGEAAYEQQSTRIGDHCFIGPLSVIAMGVTIGAGSIVGAHAFVNRDVPENTIVGGVPAQPLGRVERDESGNVLFSYANAPVSRDGGSEGRTVRG